MSIAFDICSIFGLVGVVFIVFTLLFGGMELFIQWVKHSMEILEVKHQNKIEMIKTWKE